uniref:Uncharacterized protein n=1 Tax=Pararge aegeria TaxID=116150 RepID=S4PRY2_9NEOP
MLSHSPYIHTGYNMLSNRQHRTSFKFVYSLYYNKYKSLVLTCCTKAIKTMFSDLSCFQSTYSQSSSASTHIMLYLLSLQRKKKYLK